MTALKLLECINEISDIFIHEAESFDLSEQKTINRKRVVKYSVAGVAVSVSLAVAYWKLKKKAA